MGYTLLTPNIVVVTEQNWSTSYSLCRHPDPCEVLPRIEFLDVALGLPDLLGHGVAPGVVLGQLPLIGYFYEENEFIYCEESWLTFRKI